jgi:hypothetical protein
MINAYKIPVGQPEGKRPLGRPRSRWGEIIITDLRDSWEGVEWIHLTSFRDQWWAVVNKAMNLERRGI